LWRNTVVVEFIAWLRAHNEALPPQAQKVGFYGLDLYSLYTSMKAVLRYLEKVDPEAAKRHASAIPASIMSVRTLKPTVL
jgi:erythromycin esterase-like protein